MKNGQTQVETADYAKKKAKLKADFGFSTRTLNCLLIEFGEDTGPGDWIDTQDLMRVPNMGPKCVAEVVKALNSMGLKPLPEYRKTTDYQFQKALDLLDERMRGAAVKRDRFVRELQEKISQWGALIEKLP